MKKIYILWVVLLCLASMASAATEDELFDKGVALLKQEKAQEAVDVFSQLIEMLPDSPDAYRNRGVGFMKLSRYDDAIDDFHKAIELKSDLKDLYSNMGVAWYYKKEYRRAIEFYDMELALRPENHFGYFNRAICWAALKEFDKGIADTDKSLALLPDHYLALCLKGDLLVKTGRKKEAVVVYQQALGLDPENAYAKRRVKQLDAEGIDEQTVTEDTKASEEDVPVTPPVKEKEPAAKSKSKSEPKSVVSARYELQVGAYRGKENAENMLEKLIKNGYQARILTRTGKKGHPWHMVRIGPFGTRAEAAPDKETLQADLGLDAVIRPWGEF